MERKDWYEAGEAIRNLVQDAVENQDFTQLSETIASVVNQTMDSFQDALKDSLGTGSTWDGSSRDSSRRKDSKQDPFREKGAAPQEQTARWQGAAQEAAERIRRNLRERKQEPAKLKAPGRISGIMLACVGYGFGSMFGLALAILGIIADAAGPGLEAPLGLLAILFAASMGVGIGGSRRLGLARRFQRYAGLLKGRTYCELEELASGIGRSVRFVRRDVRKMIHRGFFPEGHLDRKETCLITDNETYQQYLLAERAREEAVPEGGKSQEPQKEQDSGESWECGELLQEGERYIRHIRECNDRIPGREISAKLDQLELVVTRIFREVERRPQLAPELRRMMSYYLPTTQKLIDAYCQLDEQPVGGQNIDSTKKEIEDALDTINHAFGNLLDSFFENTAWDISSDISVLHTMFAQEGLTGRDFAEKVSEEEKGGNRDGRPV